MRRREFRRIAQLGSRTGDNAAEWFSIASLVRASRRGLRRKIPRSPEAQRRNTDDWAGHRT